MDAFWPFLLDILILLAGAMALGALCEWLRQSAIVGYLLAGTLFGPGALGLTANVAAVHNIAELGVALLLFSIGLEFNWRRLRALGPRPVVVGALQLSVTLVVAALVALPLPGIGFATALAIGAVITLSSTTVVLRTLTDRAEIDSVHGRNALSILLLQDVAVVPLVLLVTALGGEGDPASVLLSVGEQVLLAGLVVVVFALANLYLLPRIIRARALARNRELPILFAIVTALGATWGAHALGMSPALGAFIAGVVMGGSPVATQIRADIGPLRVLFVTLFFSSIGMLADLAWIAENVALVLGLVAAVVVGKAAIIWGIGWILGYAHRQAVALGLSVAQIGEFSFVLAEAGRRTNGGGVFSEDLFLLLVSVTIGSLIVTPFLMAHAVTIGNLVEGWLGRATGRPPGAGAPEQAREGLADHVIIVGFGPAGRAVAEAVRALDRTVIVIEMNPNTARIAEDMGLRVQWGDATSAELLEAAHVHDARAVIVTVPDHRAAVQTIRQVRALAPSVQVIARARYQAFVPEIDAAGAHAVVCEESTVGRRLGLEVRRALRQG